MAGYRGKQGRKPKASTIVERERAREPRPRSEKRRLPSPPDHVRNNEMALAEWKRMGRILLDTGLLGNGDTSALAAYCIAYARWVDAENHLQPTVDEEGTLQKFGVIVKSRYGVLMPSPYLPIANRAMEQMTKLLGEFGMTPASRSRLPQAQQERKPKRAPPSPRREGDVDPRDILRLVSGGKG